MKKKILCLKGDGVGPEVVAQAVKVAVAINNHFGHQFEFDYGHIGAESIDLFGEPLTENTLEKCRAADAILLGAIGDPKYDNAPELKVRPEQGLLKLRKELQLYSNIRPVVAYPLLDKASPLKYEVAKGTDIVIYRELCGGLYFGDKQLSEDGEVATETCVYSKKEIVRIAHLAFKEARKRKGKLTLVDKANVLETSRLWRKVVNEIADEYIDVKVEYMFVDNAAMQLMLAPTQFDVILTENLFGDILSDLASVITGSLGMLPSASIGEQTAMFEPVHGSYPEGAGKDIANPMATILSLAMMYDYLELPEEASFIRQSVNWAMSKGIVTPDLSKDDYKYCSIVGDMISIYIENAAEVQLNQDNITVSPTFF